MAQKLDFPAKPAAPAEPPPGLVSALGVAPREVHRNVFDYLVVVEDEAGVRAAAPDFAALRKVEARGVIVTWRSDDAAFDFVSRFFAPAVGVDEDPVTGSAHCCLGAFWAARLGRTALRAFQASRRGGVVRLEVRGDRVALAGYAVTVLRGELITSPPVRGHPVAGREEAADRGGKCAWNWSARLRTCRKSCAWCL